MKNPDSSSLADKTRAIVRGRAPEDHHGVVNTPVYRASTVLHPTVEAFEQRHDPSNKQRVVYGLLGTPSTFDLEEVIADLEGGHDAVLLPSGLAAITTALTTFLEPGDHVLIADTVYWPNRMFCDEHLRRLNVDVEYYDPMLGAKIASRIRPATKVIFLESPGSLTFEVQDIPAITAVARAHGVTTILDNTWATPVFLKPFSLGIDVSVHAATKYLSGHSDIMMGVIVSAEHVAQAVRRTHRLFGQTASPDDAYTTLRSVRTLSTRLKAHETTGIALAEWLSARDEVDRVLHPALPEHPGHEFWKRDYLGACGLFGVVLKPCRREQLLNMVNGMQLFGIGASWGGYESLMIPSYPDRYRTATEWTVQGQVLRVHAGLEDLDDLLRDLDAGFARLRQ
ncbi:MAG: cystathionine beta-lyase [Gammaproteobacteria bacterium]|nr:cystathionine beta-lyase [Gammaproteobacteria bacterium]